jgi:CheY-like chemotaxis protein
LASAKCTASSNSPGGHVKIYSEVGEGTTIRLYLPRAHAIQKTAEEADNKVIGSLGRETILIAEDEPEVRSYLAETLRELNYDVHEASDAVSALALFDNKPFHIDLLLTDIVMPGMNGRRLAEELLGRQASIKVLYMTGYSRNAIVHQGRLDPGVSLLQKPITQVMLARRVRELLDKS